MEIKRPNIDKFNEATHDHSDDENGGALGNDLIGVSELKDELKSRHTITSNQLNFNYIGGEDVTLTADETFVPINLRQDKSYSFNVTGEHSISVQVDSTDITWIADDYDGTVWNVVTLFCARATSGSEIVLGTIKKVE